MFCFLALPGSQIRQIWAKVIKIEMIFMADWGVSKPEQGSCSLVWWYRTQTEFTLVHHRHVALVKFTVANRHITSLLCIRQTAPVLTTLTAALVCWHEQISHDNEKACTIPGQWNWSSSKRSTSCSILLHTTNQQHRQTRQQKMLCWSFIISTLGYLLLRLD